VSFKFDMDVGQKGLVYSCILFKPGVSRYATWLVVQHLGFLPDMEYVLPEFLQLGRAFFQRRTYIRWHYNTVPLYGVN
jgi:hypothetical protein